MSWPEFRTIVYMRNESDELEAREWLANRRRDRQDEDPAAAGLADRRLGKPPSKEELDLIPRLS